MSYLLSLPGMALNGFSIASTEGMFYHPYRLASSGGGHIELTNVTLSYCADIHPLYDLHFKTTLPNLDIREVGGRTRNFQIIDGYVTSVEQYFDNASYDYSKISIYSKDLLYMNTLPACSLFLRPDQDYKRYNSNFKAILDLGHKLVVERTTVPPKAEIIEPPILPSRQIVICR
jgi:hypothetical protein